MPQVVWQLIDALSDDRTDALKLERIIEGDMALASKVLSLANSAYYGMPQKITTISRAVVVIGYQELEFLALGAGLAQLFDLSQVPLGFDGEGLWLHSLAVSWASRELAEASGYPIPGEVMVAGLLHDLGKLVLATHLADELTRILDLVRKGSPYYKAEAETGLKHSIIGYWLAKRWSLPEIHSATIRYHHAPQTTDPYLRSTCLVSLGDILVKSLGLGLVHEAPPLKEDQLLRAAGLKTRHLDETRQSAQKKLPAMFETWRQMLAKGGLT